MPHENARHESSRFSRSSPEFQKTVVRGFSALNFMKPLCVGFWEYVVSIYNMAAGGTGNGNLILAFNQFNGRRRLSAVPRALREGAYGPGRYQIGSCNPNRSTKQKQYSGISAAIILGMSRAVGEAMIVAMRLAPTESDLESILNLLRHDRHIVRISGGDLKATTPSTITVCCHCLMSSP